VRPRCLLTAAVRLLRVPVHDSTDASGGTRPAAREKLNRAVRARCCVCSWRKKVRHAQALGAPWPTPHSVFLPRRPSTPAATLAPSHTPTPLLPPPRANMRLFMCLFSASLAPPPRRRHHHPHHLEQTWAYCPRRSQPPPPRASAPASPVPCASPPPVSFTAHSLSFRTRGVDLA